MKSSSYIAVATAFFNLCHVSSATRDGFLAGRLEILDRRFTCTVPGYTQCPQADLPNDFCCPSDHICLSLGASFTILCCPQGSDCSNQTPISCDIDLQNATANPESLVKTTDLYSTMFTCGSGCCPFGFNCSTNGNCSMYAEQKQIIDAELETLTSSITTTSATSSISLTPGASTVSITTSISTSTTSPSVPIETTTNEHHSISISTEALVGGILAIIVVIAGLAAFLFWIIKRWKSKSSPKVGEYAKEDRTLQSDLLGSFIKAELDSANSRTEMDAGIDRRELDPSSFGKRKKHSIRELEGDAAHEVSDETRIHEMDAGKPKAQPSYL